MNVRTASWATVIGVLAVCFAPMAGTAVASVGDDHKVVICHVPPGNPENARSIEVDRESWSGHRNHELDYEGPCRPVTTTTTSTSTSTSTSTTSTSTTTTEPVTTTSTSTIPDTTTTSTSVPETTTSTTTTVPATTTTVAPTTTNTTQPPPSVSPETTIRDQPGPDIDYPATAERVPAPEVLGASKYQGGELALTGLPYEIATLVVGGLLIVLVGWLIVRVSHIDKQIDEDDDD